jgi:hypothetical protein
MTRRDPDFPLLPYDLSRAPELAALALLNETLHISILSLCAEHPSLQNDTLPNEPTSLRRARPAAPPGPAKRANSTIKAAASGSRAGANPTCPFRKKLNSRSICST